MLTQQAEARQGQAKYVQSDISHYVTALELMDDTAVVHQDMNTQFGSTKLLLSLKSPCDKPAYACMAVMDSKVHNWSQGQDVAVTCRCPWGCMNPPMTPKVQKRSPLGSVARPGMMVWYGRLWGATQLGCFSSRMKL